MNVLSDILCSSSPLILSSSCNGPLLSHNLSTPKPMAPKQTRLMESLSTVSNVAAGANSNQIDGGIFHVSESDHGDPNLMATNYPINQQNNADHGFSSNSYHGNVQSWFTNDLMKASENISPVILPPVAEIYSADHHGENLSMLEIGFPSEITSQNTVNCNIGTSCISNNQNLISVADAHGFPCSDSLLMSSFTDVSNSQMSIEKSSQPCEKYNNSGIVQRASGPSQPLMNGMIPLGSHCELNAPNQLLSLTNHMDDPTLSTTVRSNSIQDGQNHSHMDMMSEKLPHITLNQLDSLLDDMQMMTNGFPNVSMSDKHPCNNSYDEARLEPCNNNLGIMTCNDNTLPNLSIASFTSQQAMIEISRAVPQNMVQPVGSNATEDSISSAIEEVCCFKCKYCNFISLERSLVRTHVQDVHLKNQVQNHIIPNNTSSFYSDSIISSSNSLESNGMNSSADMQQKKALSKPPVKNTKKTQIQDNISINENNNMSSTDSVPLKGSNNKHISNKNLPMRNGTCDTSSNEVSKKVVTSRKTNSNEPKISPQRKISSHMKAWQKKIKRELGSYICEFKGCNVRFRALDNLEYHKKCHIATSGKFACPECGTNFDNWGSTAGHLWRHHSTDMELHACNHCSFRTYSLSTLENLHKPIHQDKCLFLCDTCGKGFKNGKRLRNHRVIHDKKLNGAAVKFPCPICSRQFLKKKFLRMHLASVHHNVKSYSCSYCQYTTSKSSTLRMHMRQHTGEKPFACDLCSYQTVDHNSMRRHKMTHSGEKPYKCPYCTYACIQSSTYKVHLRKQHPEQSDQQLVFSCNICPYRTVKRDNYIAHMSSHELKSNKGPITSESQRHPESEVLPLVEAVDISLSHGDHNMFLGPSNKDKDVQSYLWNESCIVNGEHR